MAVERLSNESAFIIEWGDLPATCVLSTFSRFRRSCHRNRWEIVCSAQTLIASTCLFFLTLQTARADDAEIQIVKLGGKLTRDTATEGMPVIAIALNNLPVIDVDLRLLTEFGHLQSLSIGHTKVTDRGIRELQSLKNLQSLYLNNTSMSDVGLRELKQHESLRSLDLTATTITDAGMAVIGCLRHLNQLTIGETKVTDAGLKEIEHLATCRHCGSRTTRFLMPDLNICET